MLIKFRISCQIKEAANWLPQKIDWLHITIYHGQRFCRSSL